MSVTDRLKLFGAARQLGFPTETQLRQWIQKELGSLEVLERPTLIRESLIQAIPPKSIYHLGAGNLSVSLHQSLLVGLILGAKNFVKPATGTMGELKDFHRKLPTSLRSQIIIEKDFNANQMRMCDAVIALGSDETLDQLRPHPKQRFIAYGHRLSLIWIGKKATWTPSLAQKIWADVSTYDQQGCLSPQMILLDPGISPKAFGDFLSKDWSSHLLPLTSHPCGNRPPSIAAAAQIQEIRDTARGKGDPLWVSPQGVDWTLLHSKTVEWHSLPRVIPLIRFQPKALAQALEIYRFPLSTIGVAGELPATIQNRFITHGACRFCPVGKMQFPSVDWLHDGRPQLSDLVRWVEFT